MATSSSKPKYGYRPNPQFSASQMAEYLGVGTSSTRRTNIIREARFPKTSAVALYDRARQGLTSFMVDGTRSMRHFADTIDQLERRKAKIDASTWIKNDSQWSIEALQAFQKHYNKLTLRRLDCQALHGRQPLIARWPTKISVALDCTTHKPQPDGQDHIGGVILLFSRGESSTKARVDRSKTIAGIVYSYATEFLSTRGEPDPELCFAVDVFGGVAHSPPGTFARKLRNIEDACGEIADRWLKISPPSDYDGPDV